MTDIAAAIDAAIDARAPLLKVGASGISPRAALKAIAAVESEGGRRWRAPRHENSYCYGGPYYVGDGPGGAVGDDELRELTDTWGCSAHESWGPWQVLFITAYENGYRDDPVRLRDPAVSIEPVIAILNRRLFALIPNPRPEDVFDTWNSGRARDRNYPAGYVSKALPIYKDLVS